MSAMETSLYSSDSDQAQSSNWVESDHSENRSVPSSNDSRARILGSSPETPYPRNLSDRSPNQTPTPLPKPLRSGYEMAKSPDSPKIPQATSPRKLKRRPINISDRQRSTSRGRTHEREGERKRLNLSKDTPSASGGRSGIQITAANLKTVPNNAQEDEAHKILSDNIKKILRATKSSSDDEDEDDDDTTGVFSGADRPQKRRRSHSRSGKTLEPMHGGRASKKFKWEVPDLAELDPEPIQLEFEQHPIEDRDDQWYVSEFEKLFHEIEKFFEDYFCIQDIDQGENYQPWALNHTPEFLNYVLQTAEQDPHQGGWDAILRHTKQRKWLLTGILMRILEKKVFDEDLWGATKEQKDLLFAIEKALLTHEGFSRTKLRSETVNTILGPGPITPDFHPEVAKLTAQITLLFKPLSDFLNSMPPPEGQITPAVWDQYQALHNVISRAAYLSLCVRLSPSIFFFTPLSPNDKYTADDQDTLEHNDVLKKSKLKIESPWDEKKADLIRSNMELADNLQINLGNLELAKTKYRAAEHKASQLREQVISMSKRDVHYAERRQEAKDAKVEAKRLLSSQMTLESVVETLRTEFAKPCVGRPGSVLHHDLVKIAAWPNIRRFKPGSTIEEKEIGMALEEMTGFRIFEISKSAAVFYCGVANDERRAEESVCLRSFHEQKLKLYRKNVGVGRIVSPVAVAAVTATAVTLLCGRTGVLDMLMDTWRRGVESLPELPALPTLTLPGWFQSPSRSGPQVMGVKRVISGYPNLEVEFPGFSGYN